MAKVKLSDWINENVPDDAVWGQYYVIARKEEIGSATKVGVEQTVRPAPDATITGKEIKAHLEDCASPSVGVFLIIAGIVLAVAEFLLRKPMDTSTGFLVIAMLPNLGMIIGGIYFIDESAKTGA